ncbi:hypothetical protein ACIQ62_17560 [Streptomyces sp. NPDC096319]
MHARRTTLLLLLTLLTSACVAVPHERAPAPPTRPGRLAPAADRPPAPLPVRPAPTEPAPRETLAATGPRPDPRPPRTPARTATAAGAPAPDRPRAHQPAPTRPHTTASKPGRRTEREQSRRKSGTRPGPGTVPASPRTTRHVPAAPHRQPDARPPEMRRLCRQAESIQAPMGAADLCRGAYGG